MHFTSVAPEYSRGINCVIQKGPMVCVVWNIFVRVPGQEDRWPFCGYWLNWRRGRSYWLSSSLLCGVTKKLLMCQMFMCLFWPLTIAAFTVPGKMVLSGGPKGGHLKGWHLKWDFALKLRSTRSKAILQGHCALKNAILRCSSFRCGGSGLPQFTKTCQEGARDSGCLERQNIFNKKRPIRPLSRDSREMYGS